MHCRTRAVDLEGGRLALPPRSAWAWLVVAASFAVSCTPKTPDTDWPTYLGDAGRGHYSELTEIDRGNVGRLAVAWRYDAGELQPGVSVMDTSPLVVGGVLFGLSPTLDAFALDAATGAELWRSEAPDGVQEQSQRGLLWWPGGTDGGAEAGLYYVAGSHLVALEPHTGKARAGFGVQGRLDLWTQGTTGAFGVAGPGLVVDDRIVLAVTGTEAVGCGAVIAVNAVDGGRAWRADLCELAAGNPSTAMAFDASRGLVFVPVEAGGVNRSPPAPVSATLLALDAATGELRWRQAIYRRESWHGRLASPPVLVRFPGGGQAADAVALATRRGHLFLFDRDSGVPLHPMAEQHGEAVSALKFVRQTFLPSERPAASGVADRVATLETAPWTPPTTAGTLVFPGVDGGAGWGGAAFYPTLQRLILNVRGNRQRSASDRGAGRVQQAERVFRQLCPLSRRRSQGPLPGPSRPLRCRRAEPRRSSGSACRNGTSTPSLKGVAAPCPGSTNCRNSNASPWCDYLLTASRRFQPRRPHLRG